MRNKKAVTLYIVLVVMYTLITTPVLCAQDSVTVNEESGKEYRAGLERFNRNEYPEAIAHFERAWELDGRNINALFAHGLALARIKNESEAAIKFQQVLEMNPEHEKALKMLASSYARTGDNELALAVYDRGMEAYPDDYFFYLGKAVAYIQLGNHTDSVPLLRTAIEKEPGRLELYERLMSVYRETGDIENTHTVAETILQKNENHAQARIAAADSKRLKGNLEAALRDYETAANYLETKAYSEHFIEVIKQQLEEIEIEKEYQARQQEQNQ